MKKLYDCISPLPCDGLVGWLVGTEASGSSLYSLMLHRFKGICPALFLLFASWAHACFFRCKGGSSLYLVMIHYPSTSWNLTASSRFKEYSLEAAGTLKKLLALPGICFMKIGRIGRLPCRSMWTTDSFGWVFNVFSQQSQIVFHPLIESFSFIRRSRTNFTCNPSNSSHSCAIVLQMIILFYR
jgi:hypothetical protein